MSLDKCGAWLVAVVVVISLLSLNLASAPLRASSAATPTRDHRPDRDSERGERAEGRGLYYPLHVSIKAPVKIAHTHIRTARAGRTHDRPKARCVRELAVHVESYCGI